MRVGPQKPYKGVLAEPMKLDPDNPAAGLGDALDRLIALQEHYELPDLSSGSLATLAIKLAYEYVPGLQIEPPPKGRRPKHPLLDFMLFAYMCAAEEDGKSLVAASRHLEKKGLAGKLKASGIRQRYILLKKSGPELDRLVEYIIQMKKSEKAE